MLNRVLSKVETLLIPLVALMGVAACGPPGPGELTSSSQASSAAGSAGLDYSDWRPNPATLVADGYSFVARYYAPDDSLEQSKVLFQNEADQLIAAGLDIVVVFGDGASNSLDGYNQGVNDANIALSEANAAGQPSDRPIYFAVDFDASAYALSSIEPYFQGVASVIGLSRTGCYGGYFAINGLFNAGLIEWGWQTYAWSGGEWDSRAQFRQTQNDIFSGNADQDQAIANDFGQWGSGGQVAPPATCSLNGQSYNENTCTQTLQCSGGQWVARSGDPAGCLTAIEPGGACAADDGTVQPQNTCTSSLQCDNGVWVDRSSDPSACNGTSTNTGDCTLGGNSYPQSTCTQTLQCDNGSWVSRSSDPTSCASGIEPGGACVADDGTVQPQNTCTSTLQCDNGVWVDRSSDPAACL